MIEAGKESQIEWAGDNWILLDMGFSGAEGAQGKTCGLIIGHSDAKAMSFADVQATVVRHVAAARSSTNLVIEAPLSVCFREGLPVGRSVERKDGKNRYWYIGAGCAVMVASMYLIRAIKEAAPPETVRLFEAFISFKEPGRKSDHCREARVLRDVIRDPQHLGATIVGAEALKAKPSDQIQSAFRVIGIDCGVPPVIVL